MITAALFGASGGEARQAPEGTYPQTTITYGPFGWTKLKNPVYAYESNVSEARFECRLDSVPFAPCGLVEEEAYESGPNGRYEPVSEGRHVFEVRAVSPAGLIDPTPARAPFIVDRKPPSAEISGRRFRIVHRPRPKFGIRVSGQSSFLCRLRGKKLTIVRRSCDGRHSFRPPRPLPEGEYELSIVAFDRAGNKGIDVAYFVVRGVPRHGEVP
jgi:hypothetical protein